MIYLYLHFVETKNLRVDSSGDLDFPQLENSLQVKPFLLTPISLIRHKKNTNPETNTHSLPSLISLPFMPCISYNSEKPEESSLPPRVGQEHCQQQFHHRFVCLHLFFPSTTFSPSDKLRERRATQQSRDCNLAIILISTVVMFFLCHLPRVVTRLVFFTLLWSPSPTPWPTTYSPTQSSAFMRRRTSTPSSIAGKEVYLEFYIQQRARETSWLSFVPEKTLCNSIIAGRDKTPIWFMYITNAVQLLMVGDRGFLPYM